MAGKSQGNNSAAGKKDYSAKRQTRVSKARLAALEAIADVRINKAFVRDVMDRTLSKHALSASDRAFATKLAIGVVQTRLTLDDVIYRCVKSPQDIKPNVMDALRLSTYEMIYLEKQHHAAVDQGVELVKSIKPKAKGLANLVLRRVAKLAREFPFGDPEADLQAFCLMYSIPAWICKLLRQDLGNDGARYLISSSNGQPPCYVFVNQIKASVDEVVQMFDEIGAHPEKVDGLCGVELSACVKIGRPAKLQNGRAKRAMSEGKFLIADAASQAVVEASFLNCEQPENMLELCAGKGNKTIMFQSLAQQKWGSQLDLYVLDNLGFKTEILRERCERYGVKVSGVMTADASDAEALKAVLKEEFGGYEPMFDMIFVDAPCSGLGTLRRHPELKWRITPTKILELAECGYHILENASEYLTYKGRLAYATCTVTSAENQQVVQRFLQTKKDGEFNLMQFPRDGKTEYFFRTQTVGGLNDSHFLAVLQR